MRTLDEMERAAYIEDDQLFLRVLAATEEVERDLDYQVRDLTDQLKLEVARADKCKSEREDLYEMLEEISFALISRSEGLSQEQTQGLSDLIAAWQEKVPLGTLEKMRFTDELNLTLSKAFPITLVGDPGHKQAQVETVKRLTRRRK